MPGAEEARDGSTARAFVLSEDIRFTGIVIIGLKAKYAKPINKPKKGIYCEVEFFETHRCTELFFLYYFRYASRSYDEQEPLLNDLNKCVEYQKTIDFFVKAKGLHGYFERNGGSLEKAIANVKQSMEEKQKSGRDYTYSELGRLMSRLSFV